MVNFVFQLVSPNVYIADVDIVDSMRIVEAME